MTFNSFSAAEYGPIVADLLRAERLPELGPGSPDPDVRQALERLSVDDLSVQPAIRDRAHAECCLAGLWLWFDYLDESHQISQSISSADGSYWHGIMHRREPDYSNAKYWFRQVGQHAIFGPLAEFARTLPPDDATAPLVTADSWDPFLFIDVCQQEYGTGSTAEQTCRLIARAEWQLLFRG